MAWRNALYDRKNYTDKDAESCALHGLNGHDRQMAKNDKMLGDFLL